MKLILLNALFLAFFFSCSTPPPVVIEIPDKPNPSKEKTETNPIPDKLDIKVVDYNAPYEEKTSNETSPEDPTVLVTENNIRYTIVPTREDFRGGAVIYNYVPNQRYKIYLAPFNLVDLQLEAGEQIVAPPACGDTSNFILGTSASFQNGLRVEHVYLKAVYADKKTSLSINTNKRVYQFSLYSYKELFMPMVSFNYPLDSFEAMKKTAEIQQRNSLILSGNITDFNFSYDIIPMSPNKPKWCPALVFDDGKKTYFNFPSAKRAAYAPVLFIIEDGKKVLCNYRVLGDYYIVDQLFDRAELVLDVNLGNIISISKRS
jgi:P-type conjugative transfer protein TrbG